MYQKYRHLSINIIYIEQLDMYYININNIVLKHKLGCRLKHTQTHSTQNKTNKLFP